MVSDCSAASKKKRKKRTFATRPGECVIYNFILLWMSSLCCTLSNFHREEPRCCSGSFIILVWVEFLRNKGWYRKTHLSHYAFLCKNYVDDFGKIFRNYVELLEKKFYKFLFRLQKLKTFYLKKKRCH